MTVDSSSPEGWAGEGGRSDRPWVLREHTDRFELRCDNATAAFVGADANQLRVARRWVFFHELEVVTQARKQRLRGLSRSAAASLREALRRFTLRTRVMAELQMILAWVQETERVLARAVEISRWIDEETISSLEASRPDVDTSWWFSFSEGAELAAVLTAAEHAALETFGQDLRHRIIGLNELIVQHELVARREFFDRVETSPLTEEQARAVICFDNRVNVVAAAGSGKTSVMVARAAYAIHRGFVPPERILLLAFNKAAADELQERVTKRLAAVGLAGGGLKASTFHSFGLSLIGNATGSKPRLASWVDGGQDVDMVTRIVDELRDESFSFRLKWDMFRLLFARVDDDLENEEQTFDAWDKTNRRTGLHTFRGEIVKSQGERMIADWLFLNGVDYRYEHPYSVDVATPDRSQYRPDFYYPSVDVWHEHWAIGHDGEPPESFKGYRAGMVWKRDLHASHGSTLVETTWAGIIDTSGFAALADDLRRVGVQLDWNPDRPIPGVKPVNNKEMARLVRTFMAHVKSNSLTRQAMDDRLKTAPTKLKSHRTRLFVDLYWQIHDRWEKKLAADGFVDFEDMLVHAAEHVENGTSKPGYDLVLVDEFQDASQARARLVAALVRAPRQVSAGSRRRLAGNQPVRGSGHLGHDGLREVVRAGSCARVADDISVHSGDLQRLECLRLQKPAPAPQDSQVRTQRTG